MDVAIPSEAGDRQDRATTETTPGLPGPSPPLLGCRRTIGETTTKVEGESELRAQAAAHRARW